MLFKGKLLLFTIQDIVPTITQAAVFGVHNAAAANSVLLHCNTINTHTLSFTIDDCSMDLALNVHTYTFYSFPVPTIVNITARNHL